MKGRIPWNKGLGGKNNPFYGKRVLIELNSKSLGDTLAWISAVSE
ncbi:unnamed protein product, partial [marine sediment metagenome]